MRFLSLAEHVSRWSKDPSTQVGAVIVDPRRRVVSVGYNGLPQGVEDSDDRLNDRELKYKLIQHAERNAILFARGSVEGCTLYTHPFLPCASCAGMLIQAGIAAVVSYAVDERHRWRADIELGKQLLDEAGVEWRCV
jgi:dCMP deaminase